MFDVKNGRRVINEMYRLGVEEYSIGDFYTRVDENPQAWHHMLLIVGVETQPLTDVVAYLHHVETTTGDDVFTVAMCDGTLWAMARMLDAMWQNR